jgi:hypothetical protein
MPIPSQGGMGIFVLIHPFALSVLLRVLGGDNGLFCCGSISEIFLRVQISVHLPPQIFREGKKAKPIAQRRPLMSTAFTLVWRYSMPYAGG